MTCTVDALARRISILIQKVGRVFAWHPHEWMSVGDFTLVWHTLIGEDLPGIDTEDGYGFFLQLQKAAVLTLFVPIPGHLWVRLHPSLAPLVADFYRIPTPDRRDPPRERHRPYQTGGRRRGHRRTAGLTSRRTQTRYSLSE